MNEAPSENPALDQLGMQLTRIERLLAIGFASHVEEARERAGVADAVTAEILPRASGWTSAGHLKQEVGKAAPQSGRTVQRRLTHLVELGALERRGQTSSTEYRSTGLLG
jgi:hypothetical protein